jgi:hypothetical protein
VVTYTSPERESANDESGLGKPGADGATALRHHQLPLKGQIRVIDNAKPLGVDRDDILAEPGLCPGTSEPDETPVVSPLDVIQEGRERDAP